MARWLVKSDPETYSFSDLERDQRTVWDGVANNTALIHLRKFAAGDEVLVYHTGDERAAVGVARVVKSAYRDPKQDDPKLVVVDLEFVRRLERAVGLPDIKKEKSLAKCPLVTIGRLSVMPVSDPEWDRLIAMGSG